MLNNIYKLFFLELYKFKGRSSRKQYIARLLLIILIIIRICCIDKYRGQEVTALFSILNIFTALLLAIYIIQYFPLTIRRLHDLNVSGRWILVTLFIPWGQLMILWLMLAKGTSGTNKYGEEPMY
jgi:uncharacterized membrane protein YhaH (DUF805 family)